MIKTKEHEKSRIFLFMGEMEIANQIVVGYPEGQYDFGDVECMEL
jgi:hypothetical protein